MTRPSISDVKREHHIKILGRKMEAAMARWAAYGSVSDRDEAHRWRMTMEAAIKARSRAQVARLERERGLS